MEYPKRIMKKNELISMGMSESFLNRVARHPGQTVAWRVNPLRKNTTLLFDTVELEKIRLAEIKMAEKERRRRVGAYE